MATQIALFQNVNLQQAVNEANGLLSRHADKGIEIVSMHLDKTVAVAGTPGVHQWHLVVAVNVPAQKKD